MRVLELNHDGGMLMQAIRAARAIEPPRTGVHVSTINDDINKQLAPGKYDGRSPIKSACRFRPSATRSKT
jgi:hypothetical protein